jgi:3-hydroxyacyl-[acyl-carrier-protein] dehydratase
MKFTLVDRIVLLQPRERIVARKAVTLGEEYLADHFPTFPVMPGVLMLEVMIEAGAWLVHHAESFTISLILLRSARNVTYRSFVRPGEVLEVDVACRRVARDESEFAGTGSCEGREVVRARFTLVHVRLRERSESLEAVDRELTAAARARFSSLWAGS